VRAGKRAKQPNWPFHRLRKAAHRLARDPVGCGLMTSLALVAGANP